MLTLERKLGKNKQTLVNSVAKQKSVLQEYCIQYTAYLT